MTREVLDKLMVIGWKYTALKGEKCYTQTNFPVQITLYTIKCEKEPLWTSEQKAFFNKIFWD